VGIDPWLSGRRRAAKASLMPPLNTSSELASGPVLPSRPTGEPNLSNTTQFPLQYASPGENLYA